MNALAPIADKLGKLIRLLSSDQPGEVIAAVQALRRTLQGAGGDFHVLAETVEKSNAGISKADMQRLYDAGFQDGKSAAEPVEFHKVDTELSSHEIACHCRDYGRLLDDRERKFIEEMCRWTVHGGKPSERQAKWLRAIYARR